LMTFWVNMATRCPPGPWTTSATTFVKLKMDLSPPVLFSDFAAAVLSVPRSVTATLAQIAPVIHKDGGGEGGGTLGPVDPGSVAHFSRSTLAHLGVMRGGWVAIAVSADQGAGPASKSSTQVHRRLVQAYVASGNEATVEVAANVYSQLLLRGPLSKAVGSSPLNAELSRAGGAPPVARMMTVARVRASRHDRSVDWGLALTKHMGSQEARVVAVGDLLTVSCTAAGTWVVYKVLALAPQLPCTAAEADWCCMQAGSSTAIMEKAPVSSRLLPSQHAKLAGMEVGKGNGTEGSGMLVHGLPLELQLCDILVRPTKSNHSCHELAPFDVRLCFVQSKTTRLSHTR
jgi:hypothetical protein